ncbi:MAG: hypothetical protein SVN78_04295 [Deferribacterota bacterium]|nr:hypothetical protein [Deferribacterota bacterium]
MFIRDGLYPILTILLILAIIVFLPIYIFIAILILLLTYLILVFRIPNIKASPFPRVFLSPVNGKIISIKEKVLDKELFNEVTIRICPFMSHINLIPLSGRVTNITSTYDVNTSKKITSTMDIITEFGSYKIKQVAEGYFKRIKNNLVKDDIVETHDFFGYTIFKANIVLYIPKTFEITVSLKDSVKAGLDVISRAQ